MDKKYAVYFLLFLIHILLFYTLYQSKETEVRFCGAIKT